MDKGLQSSLRKVACVLPIVIALAMLVVATVVASNFVETQRVYRITDEGITFSAGNFDLDTLRAILRDPPRPYVMVIDGGPTLSYRSVSLYIEPIHYTSMKGSWSWRFELTPLLRAISDTFGWVSNGLKSAMISVLNFFSMNAVAADRYAVLNDAACVTDTWNTTTCWSTTSGGASGASVPGAADTALFNAASGSGTMTYDLASSTISQMNFGLTASSFTGTLAIGANTLIITGTLSMRGSSGTITVSSGTLDPGNAFFDGGPSLSITGSGTFTPAGISAEVGSTGSILISGAATITTNFVNILASGFFISNTGASTWSVTSGIWRNSSTSVSWLWNNGTITFSSPASETMIFAGSNLAVAEFFNVTFASSAGTPQTFTMTTRGLFFGGTLTITDTTSTTTLNAGSFNITGDGLATVIFGANGILTTTGDIVDINDFNLLSGQMTMDTITVTGMRIQVSDGNVDITQWTAYNTSTPDIRWTFNASVPSATVTITAEGLATNAFLGLQRDSVQIDSAFGTITFAVSGGWSSNTMQIGPSESPSLDFMLAIFASLIIVIAVMAIIARVSKETGMEVIAEYVALGAALLAIFLALAFFLILA